MDKSVLFVTSLINWTILSGIFLGFIVIIKKFLPTHQENEDEVIPIKLLGVKIPILYYSLAIVVWTVIHLFFTLQLRSTISNVDISEKENIWNSVTGHGGIVFLNMQPRKLVEGGGPFGIDVYQAESFDLTFIALIVFVLITFFSLILSLIPTIKKFEDRIKTNKYLKSRVFKYLPLQLILFISALLCLMNYLIGSEWIKILSSLKGLQ
ncbi:MAG: hypothetical protein R8N23_06045 [Reichenbachiella sp.]|uniref:hypothetical protein n=1 Tax=Reichenbachiella sp. TaxID=2184521 RepID=UPI0029665978|nr:hypothetical protein [Reichenbachiella sp.]MDW3209407.1 hypothetical protein [Reichenbachiella sp.]